MTNHFPVERLKDPGTCLGELWGRVPKYIRTAFCSAVILGFLTHMYMFTNKFTNHDDVGALFGNSYGAASGRWFRPIALHLDGDFSMPWLIGIFSLLCLAGAACFTVSLLRIRQPLGCVLTAAVIVSFPTIAATFTYMYTATAYLLSLLLAAFGAWAAVRLGWRGSVLCVAALMMSMSAYQSYFPVAVVLMVGAMLLETLDGTHTFRELLLEGFRLVATLALSIIAYMVSVRISTATTGLVSYMGLQEMGQISLGELPQLIKNSYLKYFTFFLHNDTQCHFSFLKYAFVLTGLGTIILGILILVRRRLGPARTVLALLLALAYPLAGNLIYIMVPHAGVHTLMIYGLCFILIFPVFVAEYAGCVLQEGPVRPLYAAISWVALLTVALTAYSYMITDNNAYLKIDISMQQCELYSNRLLERVEACEDYEPGMNVVLVGSEKREAALSPTPQFDAIQLTGVLDMGNFRTSYTYAYFLRYYVGFAGPVYLGDSTQGRTFAAMEQVQAMPCYPRAGSVQVRRLSGRQTERLSLSGAPHNGKGLALADKSQGRPFKHCAICPFLMLYGCPVVHIDPLPGKPQVSARFA